MEPKNEQIKLEVQEWQITNAFVGILSVLAPAACLAIILGQTGILTDFMFNMDYSKTKDPNPLSFSSWLITLLHWPLNKRRKYLKDFNFKIRNADNRNPLHVWKDGSLLCTLVNTAVPGACKDPREHRLKPPKHGMQLVYEYFDIMPIFNEDETNQQQLTPQEERQFSKYLNTVHKYIAKQTDIINNMRYSTDYVGRGMGLVIGEQHRKCTFYIYPIPKQNQQPCDLEVSIKGPCGYSGHVIIPSILHYQQKCQPATEYRRAMYMSSKLNSISPTTQGTSFLRKLSLTSITKPRDPDLEIDIRVKISSTRAKVSYTPLKTGIYEINLISKNCHVVGSPYSVPIELPTNSSYLSNDSDNESDGANDGKYVRRKKKIISRIVDFIDEKMLLQNDGTLVKINEKEQTFEKNNENTIIKLEENCSENKTADKDVITGNKESINYKTDTEKSKKVHLQNNLIFVTHLNLRVNDDEQPSNNEDNKNEENYEERNNNLIREEHKLIENFPKETYETIFSCTQKCSNICEEKNKNMPEEIYKLINIQEEKHNFNSKQMEEINLLGNELKEENKSQNKELDEFSNTFNKNNIHDKRQEEKEFKLNFEDILEKFNQPINKQEEKFVTIKEIKIKENLINETSTSEILQNLKSEILINNNFEKIPEIITEEPNNTSNQSYSENNPNIELNNNTIFNSKLINTGKINSFTLSENCADNLNYSPPDIFEYFSNNVENSVPFTKNVNEKQNINVTLKSFVDPTLIGKVKDSTYDFSIAISDYKKTFSNKDPSKEYSIPENFTNNYLVNNLVKVFDRPQQISSNKNENFNFINSKSENILQNNSFNSPDLVKCHLKNSVTTKYENNQTLTHDFLQRKLQSIGAMHDSFDKDQCYLKNNLKHDIKQYFVNKHERKTEKPKTKEQYVILGIVDKQKLFWDQKLNTEINNRKTEKQTIIFKDIFLNESKQNVKNCNLPLKRFEGIVENNIKIFENKFYGTTSNKNNKTNKIIIQKSKSESFLHIPKDISVYNLQKTMSSEEIVKIPSIEERRNKLLQACQKSFSLVNKNVAMNETDNKKVTENEDIKIDQTPEEETLQTELFSRKEILSTKDKHSSVKRKARFKRAKLYFHQLEGSDPKLTIDETLQIDTSLENTNQILRSESDPCVAYNDASSFTKSLKISDRFPVDDLFQDILGDDKRFIGLPNKNAVVASLASLDSDSSRTAYESADEEPDMDYFTKRPQNVKKKRISVPGFLGEYPYPPSTDTWRFKTRNNIQNEELIPGRILLTKSDNNLNK